MQKLASPTVEQAPARDGTVRLVGTLRARGSDYLLEHQMDIPTGQQQWTSPVITRLMSTARTVGDPIALINKLVTLTGRPEYRTDRDRVFVVLDNISLA